MVKDHSDSEKGKPLRPHRLLFPISSKGYFISTIQDRIAHTTAFVTPVVEHWLEREIAQCLHPMKDRSVDQSHHERTLLPRSYISLSVSVRKYCASVSQFWATLATTGISVSHLHGMCLMNICSENPTYSWTFAKPSRLQGKCLK